MKTLLNIADVLAAIRSSSAAADANHAIDAERGDPVRR